ncbi:MAG TPA: hypothetical protein VE155_03720 [Pseudonocardiaceae bacterium]|nr:hypothetical protein [Pseudonocardiaceae bacterium]
MTETKSSESLSEPLTCVIARDVADAQVADLGHDQGVGAACPAPGCDNRPGHG